MFTGIIEAVGTIVKLQEENNNLHITLQAPFVSELKIDQSISHNGVCLTVIDISENTYTVTAIQETLQKTNLKKLNTGDSVNLERCVKVGSRLDGHIVQGHVDGIATLKEIRNEQGSYALVFTTDEKFFKYIVEKGSICINGISLTVVDTTVKSFSVAIIPFTWQNTNLRYLQIGDTVNIEVDILAKYIEKMMR